MIPDPLVSGLATFAVGVAVLWCGLSLLGKSFSLSVSLLLGGCSVAALGAASAFMNAPSDGVRAMAWPACALLGGLLYKFGPMAAFTKPWRIVLAAISVIFAGSFVSGANRPSEGIVGIFIISAFLLSLAWYRPVSRWARSLRSAAYVATGVFAASSYVGLRSGIVMTRQGCFSVVDFPFGYELRLPHPYDYYVVDQFTKYLILASLLLTVVFSVACLGKWLFDAYKVKALGLAKPLK